MPRTPIPRRSGLSLLEVLVAIFVMGIGVISLLVLFPLGLQNAKWALDNEQIGRAAATGAVMAEVPHLRVADVAAGLPPLVSTSMQTLRVDETYRPQTTNSSSKWWMLQLQGVPAQVSARIGRPWFLMFSPNPRTTAPQWTFATQMDPVSLLVPNAVVPVISPPVGSTRLVLPPVFVDPAVATQNNMFTRLNVTDRNDPVQFVDVPYHVGATASVRLPFANHLLSFVGTSGPTRLSLGLSRMSLSQYDFDNLQNSVPPPVLLQPLRMNNETSMGDEVSFNKIGRPEMDPANPSNKTYYSSRRFSWAYVCRWVDYANTDVCDVSVVLFNARPLQSSALTGNPPGEESYVSSPAASASAGHDNLNFGRMFIKGSTTAVVAVAGGQGANIRAGDWILDNTFILPEFDENFPQNKAPFLDQYHRDMQYNFNPGTALRPGLCGGHFYKVLAVGDIRVGTGGATYQVLSLDRPAKSDGFVGTVFAGVGDVIEKGVGRMPLH